MFAALLGAIYNGVGAHTFVLHPNARPTLIAEWFAIGAAVVAWRRGARGPALQAGLLIGAAWAIDSAFSLRGIKDAYLIFSDPFLLTAAALMLAQFPDLFASKVAHRWAAGLAALVLLWSHVEPIKLAFSKRGPEQSCEWMPAYVPGITFPYCPS